MTPSSEATSSSHLAWRSREPRRWSAFTVPVKLDTVRNNAAEPSLGHVIMFGATTLGWLVLFLINLTMFAPNTGWWTKAVFSGTLMVASAAFAVVLWRRMARNNASRNSAAKR